jgi:hypothetical protein
MISECLKLTHAMSIYMYLWGYHGISWDFFHGGIMGFSVSHHGKNRVHLEMGYIPAKWQFYEGKI